MRPALLTATLFLLAVILLADVRPLWLDEILQLIDTRQPSAAELIARLPRHSGSAPLGYLVQQATLRITGYSVRRARLPEAIFGSAIVFLVALLGAELGLKRGWMGAVIFAAFPLILRYATEGRMYSQALFFSVLATLVYVRLAKKPGWAAAAACWLSLTAAAYTQPYAASVGLALVLWSLVYRERKAALLGGTAFALAIAAFLPWYLWSKARWVDDIAQGAQHFSASAKTPLMLFRELSGAGYWGSGLLLILCAMGMARRRATALLVLLIAVPMVSVFFADAWFDYFLAARQFFWVLPAVAILAAAGVERHARVGLALAALLGLVCVCQSVRFFTGPRENWQTASSAIAQEVQRGACLIVAPPGQASMYEFFQPELRQANCMAPRMVLGITPYSTNEQRQAAIDTLLAGGYTRERETVAGKSSIVLFVAGRDEADSR